MFTVSFWKDAAERAVASVAGAAVAVLSAGSLGLFEVDFANLASVSLLAGAVSILKALAASKVGELGTASLVR